MYTRPRMVAGMLLLAGFASFGNIAAAQTVPNGFAVETIHPSPGTKALGFALLPDERILVICHKSGDVNLIADGVRKSEPVLTIPNLAVSSERGLLGIAVDPDFPDANYVYLYYSSAASSTNRVSRFEVEGTLMDPASLDLSLNLASETILLEVHDEFEHHNSGTLRFGSDKTLYISHGDDLRFKPENDPYLQDQTNLYGKILRINRDGTAPDDNPVFANEPERKRPEIFAIGLRNPFRFSVDPLTDRLFIGDVGTHLREEFNLSVGGENFGYPQYEGTEYFREASPLSTPNPTHPIYDYEYMKPDRRAAIALATYRPKNFPHDYSFPEEYDGVHFHADWFDDEIRYLRKAEDGGWESMPFATGFTASTDAAIGPDGSLFVIRYGGPLQRIYNLNPGSIDDAPVASHFALHPNPFSSRTVITYRLSIAGQTRLDIFDVLGRRVATLVDEWQNAGSQSVSFAAGQLPSGTYLARLHVGSRTATTTLIKQ